MNQKHSSQAQLETESGSMKKKVSNEELARQEDSIEELFKDVEQMERDRNDARFENQAGLRKIDAKLSDLRFTLAEELLAHSMACRDAGDDVGALNAARLYAQQEHLATTAAGKLGRAALRGA